MDRETLTRDVMQDGSTITDPKYLETTVLIDLHRRRRRQDTDTLESMKMQNAMIRSGAHNRDLDLGEKAAYLECLDKTLRQNRANEVTRQQVQEEEDALDLEISWSMSPKSIMLPEPLQYNYTTGLYITEPIRAKMHRDIILFGRRHVEEVTARRQQDQVRKLMEILKAVDTEKRRKQFLKARRKEARETRRQQKALSKTPERKTERKHQFPSRWNQRVTAFLATPGQYAEQITTHITPSNQQKNTTHKGLPQLQPTKHQICNPQEEATNTMRVWEDPRRQNFALNQQARRIHANTIPMNMTQRTIWRQNNPNISEFNSYHYTRAGQEEARQTGRKTYPELTWSQQNYQQKKRLEKQATEREEEEAKKKAEEEAKKLAEEKQAKQRQQELEAKEQEEKQTLDKAAEAATIPINERLKKLREQHHPTTEQIVEAITCMAHILEAQSSPEQKKQTTNLEEGEISESTVANNNTYTSWKSAEGPKNTWTPTRK